MFLQTTSPLRKILPQLKGYLPPLTATMKLKKADAISHIGNNPNEPISQLGALKTHSPKKSYNLYWNVMKNGWKTTPNHGLKILLSNITACFQKKSNNGLMQDMGPV